MDNTDATKEKQEQIQQKRQEICDLKADLASAYSEIGDWKIVKTYEARMNSESDPYDFASLTKSRQAARDKINALQAEIDALNS